MHAVRKDLPELEPLHGVNALHDKLHPEGVGKLGAVAIAANVFFSKDEGGNEAVLDLHTDTVPRREIGGADREQRA
jgi:hypothetical protein